MWKLKPSPVLHMMEHGMLGGIWLGLVTWFTTLAVLLGLYIVNATDLSTLFGGLLMFALYALPTMFLVSVSSLALSFVGILFGMINGLFLRSITERIAFPTKEDTFIYWHVATTIINPTLITLLLAGLLFLMFGFALHWLTLLIFWPVIFIAAAVAFATHRYMLKLQKWGRNVEKAKNKSKRPPQNNLTYEDHLNPDLLMLSEDDVQSQMKQD